jgi:hypothetical protein
MRKARKSAIGQVRKIILRSSGETVTATVLAIDGGYVIDARIPTGTLYFSRGMR